MKDKGPEAPGRKYVSPMTPAHIRSGESADYVEVMFLESARIYRLLKNNTSYSDIMMLLQAAIPAMQPLKIAFASLESDVIEDAGTNA